MNFTSRSMIFALITLTAATPTLAQQYTGQGTVVGGATGAVIGGLIGKQDGHTTGGALIGGAVGALAGGLMGKSYDNQLTRQEYAHQQAMVSQQQQFYAQQQQQYAAVQSGVSIADVVSMSRSGISDMVILSQLQARGVQRKLEVSDIISLHQQGVSDTVISAIQAAPLSSQLASAHSYSAPPALAQPVVIHRGPIVVHEQPVIVTGPPVIYRSHHHYHRPHYHSGPRGSVSMGVRF